MRFKGHSWHCTLRAFLLYQVLLKCPWTLSILSIWIILFCLFIQWNYIPDILAGVISVPDTHTFMLKIRAEVKWKKKKTDYAILNSQKGTHRSLFFSTFDYFQYFILEFQFRSKCIVMFFFGEVALPRADQRNTSTLSINSMATFR